MVIRLPTVAFLCGLICFASGCAHNQKVSTDAEIISRMESAVVAIGTVFQKPDGSVGFEIIGSGFNVDPKGLVVTSEHVVEGHLKKHTNYFQRVSSDTSKPSVSQFDQEIELVALFRGYVGSPKKVETVALLVKVAFQTFADREIDLAVLKLDGMGNLPYLRLGNSDGVEIGQKIIVGGYPFGERLFEGWGVVQPTFAQGSISAIHPFAKVEKDGRTFLQLDATINPGNSGGPVVLPETGEVVGVVKGGYAPQVLSIVGLDQAAQPVVASRPIMTGINWAVPINKVKEMIELVKATTHEDIVSGQAPFERKDLRKKSTKP